MRRARSLNSRPAALVLVILGALPAGCAAAATTSPPIAHGSPPASPASRSTATPDAGPGGSPSARPTATLTAEPVSSPRSGQPPAGLLGAGGEPIVGHLGTFCWAGVCSDELELPAMSALPELELASAGSELAFSVDRQVGFISWRAGYSEARLQDLVPLDSGGSGFDPDSAASLPPGLAEAKFMPPPSGGWALVVAVRFASGDDASYAWKVSVP